MDKRWTAVTSADAATEEIIELILNIADGRYRDGPIDWEDVWGRVEGSELSDGTYLDLGDSLDSPAMRRAKALVRKERGNE